MIIEKFKNMMHKINPAGLVLLMLLLPLFSCDDELGQMILGASGSGLPEVNIDEIQTGSNYLEILWTNPDYYELENIELECNGKKFTASEETAHKFENLDADTEYTVKIITHYNHNRKSEGYFFKISTTADSASAINFRIISNAVELNKVREGLDGNYLLLKDIDLSVYQSGTGWTPIGTFSGTFDGGGHAITGLVINAPDDDYTGLFESLSGATIKNVHIINAHITGKDNVGGLSGEAINSTIKNCFFSGSVTGINKVAGLIGNLTNNSAINNSYSTANVNGTTSVGGLVGYNYSGTISNGYSTGSVTGTTNIGGLTGYTYNGTISNCYSTGSITGNSNVGGLVGYFNGGTLSNCYSTGKVSGNSIVGGSIGNYASGTIANVYWNSSINASRNDIGNSGDNSNITGLTTAQMKNSVNYSGWDFSIVWKIDGSTNNGYPFLRNMP